MVQSRPQKSSRPGTESTESRAESSGYGHLPNRSPSHTPVSSGPVDPHLLSPPVSEKDFDLSPFKPAESDKTSLSMLSSLPRKKRRERPQAKAYGSSSDVIIRASSFVQELGKSSSLPDMRKRTSARRSSWHHLGTEESVAASDRSQSAHSRRRHTSAAGSRRWTLALKTRTTRAISNPKAPNASKTRPSLLPQIVVELSESHERVMPRDSEPHQRQEESISNDLVTPVQQASTFLPDTPAMISLRRANSGRKTRKGSSDSAETIKIWNSRYARRAPMESIGRRMAQLLTVDAIGLPHLLHKTKVKENTSLAASSSDTSSSDTTASVTRKQSFVTLFNVKDVATTCSATAEPAMTHTNVNPAFSFQSEDSDQDMQRRTSTKVFSGINIHEIVWEDHECCTLESSSPGSSSSSRKSDTSHRKASRPSSRRRSAAINALKTTLKKSESNTRKSSVTISSFTAPQDFLVPEQRVKKPKRKTIQSVFRREWHSEDQRNFEVRNADMTRASKDNNNTAPNGHNGIEIYVKPNSSPDRVFFFPPLPTLTESQAWKSPAADINSFVSEISSRSDDDHSTPYLLSTISAMQESSTFNKGDHTTQTANNSRFDLKLEKEGETGNGERVKFPKSDTIPWRRHVGEGLGSSSHSRRQSHNVQFPGYSQNTSTMPSGGQSPARVSPSRFVLDGGYSSDATTRGLEMCGKGSERQYEWVDDLRGRRLSVQEFVKKIEKLTVESQDLTSKSERDKSVASWAEGVSFAGRSPMRRHTLKSRVTDKLGDLTEETGTYQSLQPESSNQKAGNSMARFSGGSDSASESVDWIGSQREE